MTTTHLALTLRQMRQKFGSNGDFQRGVACGNGSWHADGSTNKANVTCLACLEVIKSNPAYLR